MASISNLAVIISGQTAPLEASLKKAESKVSGFGHSFKEGFMLAGGVMGLDKLEAAMKSALKDDAELAEAAEKAEKSFGKILLKVTGIGAALPAISGFLGDTAEALDNGWANYWQQVKEGGMYLLLRGALPEQETQDRLGQMRAEFVQAQRIAEAQQRVKDIEAERNRLAEMRLDATKQELDNITQGMKSKRDSIEGELDPERERKKILELQREAKDTESKLKAFTALNEYDLLKMAEKELAIKKKAEEEQKKMMEDGKKLAEEQETLYESLIRKQDEYNRLLNAGAINTQTFQRATDKLKESTFTLGGLFKEINDDLQRKDMLAFQEHAAKLAESQIPEIERFRKEWERAQDMFRAGNLNGAGFDAIFKQYRDAVAAKQSTGPQFAGAVSGADAYTAIIKAQASSQSGATELKALEESKQQTKLQKELSDKMGKLANGGAFLQMKLLSTKGVN